MVPIDYTIDGSELRTEFLVERTGTEWLFFHKWALVPAALPVLDVTVVNASEATLNGVPVNMPNGRNSFAVFYPGEYEASLAGEYFSAAPTKATVSGRDVPVAPLNLMTEATDGLKNAVGSKVNEFLDTCADTADKQQKLQPDCPFYHTTYNRVIDGTIDWSITEYPAVSHRTLRRTLGGGAPERRSRIQAEQVDLFTGAVTASHRPRLQLHHPPGHRRRHHQGHPAPELLAARAAGPAAASHGAVFWLPQARRSPSFRDISCPGWQEPACRDAYAGPGPR